MLPGFPEAQPVAGFAGGVLIGLAALIMLLGLGRIAGVSGMTARAVGLSSDGAPRMVAALFVIGLFLGALAYRWIAGPIEARFPSSALLLTAGGLLVGFGTRLGSGCTSGHGVCGMARLSPRSLIATAVFMLSGIAAVAIVNAAGIDSLWGGW